MIGGLFKSASRLALVAVAGVMVGGVSAQAADLGGDCCADLEERVAELEATTARKGNRKVSLTISGYVNEAIWFWNDGREKNAYVTNNNHNTSRFNFTGSAKITPTWSAGYYLEVGTLSTTSSDGANQFQDDNQNTSSGLQLRHNAWWIENKDYGRVWVGRTTDASTGIQTINLANSWGGLGDGPGANNIGGGMRLRSGPSADGLFASALTWNNIRLPLASNGNVGSGEKYSVIKYVSPVMAGFIFSASWGEDDRWDAALRYAGEFSGFKLAAGVGYGAWSDGNIKPGTATATAAGVYGDGTGGDFGCAVNTGRVGTTGVNVNKDVDCANWGASASIMHVGTGLFVSGGYGAVQDKMKTHIVPIASGYNAKEDSTMWWVQTGIEQNFFGIGKTTLYGTWQEHDSGLLYNGTTGGIRTLAATDSLSPNGVVMDITNAHTRQLTLGVNQSIDAAAMDLYVYYRQDSAEISLTCAGAAACGGAGSNTKALSSPDLQMVIMGAVIRF